MGTVYAAQHLLLDQRVALKRLHPELASDESSVARFLREARAAAAIGHPCIVNVLDVGFSEDRAPFIVMELLEGESLATRIVRERRLESTLTADIVCSVLDALEVVHSRGIVHRDLKPDNVFLVGHEGRVDVVKLLDFGISKIRDFDGMPTLHTHTGIMLGTPQYMSPEQARGIRGIDHRADLYAAGVMLYEALTGRIPFEASNYHALLQMILAGTPRPVLELAPDIPPGLATLIETAMARAPEARFQTAKAMRFALNAFAGRMPGNAPALESLRTRELSRNTPMRVTLEPPTASETVHDTGALRANLPRPSSSGALPRPVPGSGPRTGPFPVLRDRPSPLPAIEIAPEEPAMRTPENVRGAMMLGAFDHIRGMYGEDALIRARDAMPSALRKRLDPVLRPQSFVPIVVFEEFIEMCDRMLGKPLVELPRAVGRTIATRELAGTLRSTMAGATVATVASRLPIAWSALYDVGQVTVANVDLAYVLEVRGAPIRSQAHALALTGLFARLVESAGAKDVRAYLVHTRASNAAVSMHLRFR